MTADILIKPTVPNSGTGDHDRFSHYIRANELAGAYIEGTPVKALCGKFWIPCHDPERFPICPDCKAIHERFS